MQYHSLAASHKSNDMFANNNLVTNNCTRVEIVWGVKLTIVIESRYANEKLGLAQLD